MSLSSSGKVSWYDGGDVVGLLAVTEKSGLKRCSCGSLVWMELAGEKARCCSGCASLCSSVSCSVSVLFSGWSGLSRRCWETLRVTTGSMRCGGTAAISAYCGALC